MTLFKNKKIEVLISVFLVLAMVQKCIILIQWCSSGSARYRTAWEWDRTRSLTDCLKSWWSSVSSQCCGNLWKPQLQSWFLYQEAPWFLYSYSAPTPYVFFGERQTLTSGFPGNPDNHIMELHYSKVCYPNKRWVRE